MQDRDKRVSAERPSQSDSPQADPMRLLREAVEELLAQREKEKSKEQQAGTISITPPTNRDPGGQQGPDS